MSIAESKKTPSPRKEFLFTFTAIVVIILSVTLSALLLWNSKSNKDYEEVVGEYCKAIASGNMHKAYSMLSAADTGRISYDVFCETAGKDSPREI